MPADEVLPRVGERGTRGLDVAGYVVGEVALADRRPSSVMMLGEMSEASPPVFSSRGQLLDREREREVFDRLLDGGRGGVLVVHGEPGVGKTALLEYAVEAGREFRVTRTSGVEAEMELAFAAVQQLCSPFLELLDRLPQPQQDALGVALGSVRGRRRIRSLSDWQSSACCPRRPRNGRSWLLLMTHNGSTRRQLGCLRSWLAACWRSGSRSCSPPARSTTRSRGLPELLDLAPAASRCAGAIGVRLARSAR